MSEEVFVLPIVVKAKKNQSANDLIRQFKKVSVSSGIVDLVKDRRFFQKPSKKKAIKKIEKSRLQKRARSLKKMKNISPQVLSRINERLGK